MAGSIVYLDASALVKRYILEENTKEVQALLDQAGVLGTASITRVEIAAAFAKAVRMQVLNHKAAEEALQGFYEDWNSLFRLHVTELVISRASSLAWDKGLRGYDATHLAAALVWQEMLEETVVMASFDRRLWEAARSSGLAVWPEALV